MRCQVRQWPLWGWGRFWGGGVVVRNVCERLSERKRVSSGCTRRNEGASKRHETHRPRVELDALHVLEKEQ